MSVRSKQACFWIPAFWQMSAKKQGQLEVFDSSQSPTPDSSRFTQIIRCVIFPPFLGYVSASPKQTTPGSENNRNCTASPPVSFLTLLQIGRWGVFVFAG